MNRRNHIIIGAAASIFYATKFPSAEGLLIIGSGIVGSIFPDLDHPKSKLNQKIAPIKGKIFKIISYTLIGLSIMFLNIKYINNIILTLIGLTFIIMGLSHHRGFTHSILGASLLTFIVYKCSIQYGLGKIYIGYLIGYTSHLICDIITKQGIELFFPFKKNIKTPLTIKTGGWEEQVIAAIASIYLLTESIRLLNLL